MTKFGLLIALSIVIVAALQEPKPKPIHAVLPVKQATECGEWK